MYNMILLVVGLLGLAGGGSAQISQIGQCGGITLMQNFVLNTFASATWYEVGKASSQNADCSSLQFTTTAGIISVSNPSVVNNFLQTSTGTITQNTAGSAQLTLTLAGSPIDFRILGTDYDNYAIAISCVDTSATQRTVNVWQLGRSVNSYDTAATLTAANNLLTNAIGLTVSALQSIDHSANACTQLPVIGNGQPVILPGQCATASIPAVQNFNVANFVGTWHEISSYYSANAVGTCARANYTLVGTTVNVVNSQVLNQRLDTITGTAALIGTDGSGRLSVTLNVLGVPIVQELLILGTDYSGYAVSYSCFNLPNDQRQVTSWILSRTRQISASSQTAVNTVIASLVDLNDAYYINTDQSDNGCFYFPTHQPGVRVVFPGQCDNNIAALPSFSLAQFVGTWHEVEAYPKQQQTGTCVNHAFTTGTTANSLNLVSNQVVNEAATSGTGSVTIVSDDGSGRLSLTMITGGQTIQFPYWILATDYTSYALAYSCENVDGDYRAVHTWKLSRAQALSAAATTAINAAMAAVQVVDQQYFENVNQTDAGCFYFPAVDASTPVIFPGQCDMTIPVQANFDPAAYMGLWHEIESYPSTFQTGSCSNALYTLVGGVVDVFNTQVINQQLDTINGTAIIPNATEPAKLLVTFPVAGSNQTISTNYWVLATDYTSYALVYTCSNLPNNQRFVFSWKLSRTKELTAPANVAINAVTANIQVLDSRYYVPDNQTAVGCFYFPEPVDGVPVVFPGQCDNTVAAVPNFNLAQFVGTWHEVEAYPKQQQTGTCVNHAFSNGTAANSLNLVSNQVVNQTATSGSGSVTIVSIDGSGRLNLTMATGGQTIQFPYWILATDYTSYALAYSCENVTDDYRAVYTWKLSRAQALSAAATTAINAAMAAVQVVDQQYFENIDQTDAGCFYYPVFEETPESIILPGSCPTVNAVGNFNPAAYLGEWFDVARYPIASQSGTCSRANYSLVDGVVAIRNTMVVNETLRVQDGIARLSATGTGLLQVTFVLENGEETVATYFILGTDYVSYSLVYNCRNLEDGTRQVFSWKLSRTPTLTPAANIAINNIINSIQGLNEAYYQIESQTDQDCFYVPELVPGESVLFRGSCDQVTGMQGFDASQYLGWWHEIERYPSDGVPGHCTSANFVQTFTNAIQVIETDVYDGVANKTTNVAVLNANGTITITRNGVASTYVVIATDYNTYSLLYSCEQVLGLASPQRRVWSAKHSKAGSLSAAAQAAMATYIEANPVLHQHLYESVNQSDSACFHYREDASEQVILRGQCDTTIPVQANFDLSQFAGTWYQIERYPYPQVSNDGTCIGARYTVNGDSVTFLNWEVLGGVLNTKEGTASVNGATLIVTLPVEGSNETVTTDLHILSTDYEDFALAYTCVNINAFERAVGAFKLSRSRQLSNAGQYAIGTYMANREELHQPHFISVSQHDDCEEPSSAFLFKSSIIVMLVCVVVQLVM